ncbi:cold-shock protein [Pseudomonas sp. MS19]|jgi:CspA family cold shock protein|nr:cold-shock protein [Pseudomonas sp. MS19]OEO23999.1 cold-shock protein [Pseudomonas sp. J237]SFU19939.1 cold shock protein (beta-ribbon, CspA family) [Pseudomonas marincola]
MLKIVHLVTGIAALLLSFVPALGNTAPSMLQHPDALYLILFAMTNLILAPQLPIWHQGSRAALQNLVSVLLILATALQALALLAPLTEIAGQPAILFSLAIAALGVLLHLIINIRLQPRTSSKSTAIAGDRETGTVKWFNTSKGFGFISRDSGDDIFVHFRAIRGEGHRVLVEGQRVEFSVMQRDKGLQAEDVIAALPTRR